MDEAKDPVLQRIDELLDERRRRRPWLAELSGIPLNTLNTIFYRNRPPGPGIATKIALALDTSLDYLFLGRGPKHPDEEQKKNKDGEAPGLLRSGGDDAVIDAVAAIPGRLHRARAYGIARSLRLLSPENLSNVEYVVRGMLLAEGYTPDEVESVFSAEAESGD